MAQLVVMGGLFAAGGLFSGVAEPLERQRSAIFADVASSTPARAVVHAALGGFRTIAADVTWLRAHVRWEQRDAAGTEALLKLTTLLDGRPLHFWLNGARMIAYDLPRWAVAEDKDNSGEANIDALHARRALAHLEAALPFHSTNSALWIERGNIELHRLHDISAAAESYRRASQQPGAPYFAARIHAELLRRSGRKREALVWLAALHPRLPASEEAAAANVVLRRIRDLESELGVPVSERFCPDGGSMETGKRL